MTFTDDKRADQGDRRRWLRHLAAGAASLAVWAMPGLALADAYPTRPVSIVVPFASGGPTDASARVVAKVLTAQLGQQVLVENKAGAGGVVGTTGVARATADGYTLLWGGTSSLAVAPALYPNVQFDPVKSFVPIGMATRGPMLLVGRAGLPPSTVQDLVAYTRQHKVSMGSGGAGTLAHLAGEYFQEVSSAQMLHVPYRGGAPALQDLLGGQIDVVFDNLSFLLPHVQSGRIKVYAVTSAQRHPLLPDVPTVAEVYGQGFEVYSWFGLVAPAGTPPEVLAKLSAAMSQVNGNAEARQALAAARLESVATTPESFGRAIEGDHTKWARVIKRANVRVDQ